jgi:hypothetical protein
VKTGTVNGALTPGRRRDVVENDDYGAFARRIVRAYARRVAAGDVEALAPLVALTAELETSIQDAVDGLRAFGYSWAEIATRLGMTRQGAWQRWGTERTTPATPSTDDGQPDLFDTQDGDPE